MARKFKPGLEQAKALDRSDPLAKHRRAFLIPRQGSRPVSYLCGHSLGLMPRRARHELEQELARWCERGVEGHFDGGRGWLDYHQRFSRPLADLLGARPEEVVAMNSLTVNLHLMLVSFFKPEGRRRKLLIERDAFPSDRYAVQSQLGFHGLDVAKNLLEFGPVDDSARLSLAAFEALLATEGERIALVLLPGVQFLTGQRLDLAAYTELAHRYGCRVGFDLAHAVGNVPLELHQAGPDFAVWCSYKYLNGGPGAVAGCFVHARWAEASDLPRFAGWWGHEPSTRFAMPQDFVPISGAQGWQLSNPAIFSLAPLAAALKVFDAAGMRALRRKSERLTGYLEFLLEHELGDAVRLLTPREPRERGCQISIRFARSTAWQSLATELRSRAVVADWRPPDVLRLAPVPLYNRFEDVYRAVRALRDSLER